MKHRDEITHLIFVSGFDIGLDDRSLHDKVVSELRIPRLTPGRLQRFGPHDVNRLYAKLQDDGASPRTQKKVHSVLHAALRYAVRVGKLEQTDAGGTSWTHHGTVPPRCTPYRKEQAHRLLEAAPGHTHYALNAIALWTGMRQGELFALRWQDLNFANGALSVRYSLQRSWREVRFEPPKTKAGRRRIELSKAEIGVVREQQKQLLARGLRACELVFPSEDGSRSAVPTSPHCSRRLTF